MCPKFTEICPPFLFIAAFTSILKRPVFTFVSRITPKVARPFLSSISCFLCATCDIQIGRPGLNRFAFPNSQMVGLFPALHEAYIHFSKSPAKVATTADGSFACLDAKYSSRSFDFPQVDPAFAIYRHLVGTQMRFKSFTRPLASAALNSTGVLFIESPDNVDVDPDMRTAVPPCANK